MWPGVLHTLNDDNASTNTNDTDDAFQLLAKSDKMGSSHEI